MRVAFYAPLKPADHPVPSGDRQLARALLQALRAGGHETFVASRFRSYDRTGDAARQARLRDAGRTPGAAPRRALSQRERSPRRLVYLSRLPQGSRLAGSRGKPRAGHPLRRRRGIRLPRSSATARGRSAIGDRWRRSRRPPRRSRSTRPTSPGFAGCAAPPALDAFVPPFLDLAAFTGPTEATAAGVAARARTRAADHGRHDARRAPSSPRTVCWPRRWRAFRSVDWELVVVGDGPARPEVEAAFARLRRRSRCGLSVSSPPSQRGAHGCAPATSMSGPRSTRPSGWPSSRRRRAACRSSPETAAASQPWCAPSRTGLLVPVGDAEAFAGATGRLLTDAAIAATDGRGGAGVRPRGTRPAGGRRQDRCGAARRRRPRVPCPRHRRHVRPRRDDRSLRSGTAARRGTNSAACRAAATYR